MKKLLSSIILLSSISSYAIECRVLPHHKISQNKQLEDNSIQPKTVISSGECIDFAENFLGKELNGKKKASAVDFIIQKSNKTIRGTVITPKMKAGSFKQSGFDSN